MRNRLRLQVEALLESSAGRPFFMRFPRELRQHYERTDRLQSDFLPAMIALGTVIIDLFTLVDYHVQPSGLMLSLLMRLGIYTPCALVAIGMSRSPRWRQHSQVIYLLVCLLATFCCIAASPVFDATTFMATQMTLLLIVSIISIGRLRLAFYGIYLALLLGGDALFLRATPFIHSAEKTATFSQILCGAVLALVAGHVIEHSHRLSYLLRLREEITAVNLSELNERLATLSQQDGLTGLANRRRFDDCLNANWQKAIQSSHPLSLVLADVDHFKQLNDTHGHLVGDKVLIALGELLRSGVRSPHDLVARFGGEEFVILLPDCRSEEASQVAERIRSRIEATPLQAEGLAAPLRITISCGVATVQPQAQDDPRLMVELADRALYRAKRAGRNQVCT